MIELILMQRVEKLGQMGEVVKVRPGYARNFLLPQKKALRASKDNLARFEEQRAQLEAQNLRRKEEAERVAERTAIVENAPVLGVLFLFNNLHAAHHAEPQREGAARRNWLP